MCEEENQAIDISDNVERLQKGTVFCNGGSNSRQLDKHGLQKNGWQLFMENADSAGLLCMYTCFADHRYRVLKSSSCVYSSLSNVEQVLVLQYYLINSSWWN